MTTTRTSHDITITDLVADEGHEDCAHTQGIYHCDSC
jgi:hypothetical protein